MVKVEDYKTRLCKEPDQEMNMRIHVASILVTLLALSMSIVGSAGSQAPFSATITVKSPNGGESWVKGSVQSIQWVSRGAPGPVKLTLIKGDTVFGEIDINAPEQGSYSWTVGDCPASGRSAEAGHEYRIRVSSVGKPSVRDDSNTSFTILPAARR